MGQETSVQVFDKAVTVRLGLPKPTGHLTAAVVLADGTAWPEVFAFDPIARLFERDVEKLDEITKRCRPPSSVALTIVILVADFIFDAVNFLTRLLRSFVGGFVGFGLFGIAFVMFLGILAWMVSLVALLYVLPLLLLSYALRTWHRSVNRPEIERLADAAYSLLAEVPPQASTGNAALPA